MAQTGAQTGGAQQREPSMEEILASIRRIIEDSDGARKPLDETDLPPQLAAAPASSVTPPAPEPSVEAPAVTAHEIPEIDPPRYAPSEDDRDEVMPQNEVEIFQAGLRETTSALDAAWQAEPAPVAANDVDFPADAPRREAAPATQDSAVETRADEGRPVLMSDHAGRQVAAAFGELSEAFAASRRRSFDEMAEEMLRPMLQDWLDNNLPTLVERLVREEIERVARGG